MSELVDLKNKPQWTPAELSRLLHLYDERIAELEKTLNTPELHDFTKAVALEAAHQRDRWGPEHDASKSPHDWAAVVTHLLGKAIAAVWTHDIEKFKHHIITIAAVCNNWHAAASRAS